MKKVILLLIAAVVFNACTEENNEESPKIMPTEGLVAYYTLDGEALDNSGNQNNGQITEAGAALDRKNNENGALQFNGIDSKVLTNTEIDDNLQGGLTFSAWIYFTGESTSRILSNYNGEGAGGACNERIGFVFGVTEKNQLNVFYAVDGDDYIGRMTVENSINKNEWIHVLGTWDGSFVSSGFKLYINGVESDTENQETGVVSCGFLESVNPFHIGMGTCATGDCAGFDGKLDDIRIYDRVLNSSDITLLSEE